MLKILFTCIQILIGFYWAGDMARQNPKIDLLVSQLEKGYGNFNAKLKDASIIDGLSILRRFYGWLAIVLFSVFFILSIMIGPNPRYSLLSFVGIGSVFGWFSIKWCLDHKNTIQEISSQTALLIAGPILLGIFDLLLQTPFMQIISEGFYRVPFPFEIPRLTNPLAIGSILSLAFALLFAFYYLITWILAAPAAMASVIVISLPVMLARLAHTVAPRTPFIGFTFVLFTIVTIWSLNI